MTTLNGSPGAARRPQPARTAHPIEPSGETSYSGLLEEVRQLRAAVSVYRQLVDRLLAERGDGQKGQRTGESQRAA